MKATLDLRRRDLQATMTLHAVDAQISVPEERHAPPSSHQLPPAKAPSATLVHPASRRAVVYPGGATLTLVHAVIGAVLTESVERELLPVASESGLPGLSGGDDAYEYDGREELR